MAKNRGFYGPLNVTYKDKYKTVCATKKGKEVTFYTPSGKCARYKSELDSGTNMFTGEVLNDCAVGYRMGYRAALGEQARIYKKQKGYSKNSNVQSYSKGRYVKNNNASISDYPMIIIEQ